MARQIVKKVPFAKLYDDGTILLEKVRFSYPHLAKPYKGDGDGEAKFGVTALMPKKTHKAAKDLVRERIDQLLKENKLKAIAPEKKFLRDGDQSDKTEYHDHYTISARETRRPPLRNRDKSLVQTEDAAEVFYAGCIGAVLIRPWYQNNNYGKRVNAGLAAVQFIEDAEPFGEGRLSDDDVDDTFDSYDDGDGDYDSDGGDDDDI